MVLYSGGSVHSTCSPVLRNLENVDSLKKGQEKLGNFPLKENLQGKDSF